MSNNNTILVAIVAIVGIGFLVSESGQVSNLTGDSHGSIWDIATSCTDSDDGMNPFTPGTVTAGTATYNDRCTTTRSRFKGWGSTYLEEGYCSGNNPGIQKVSCPGRCVTTGGIGHCI